MLGSAFLIYVGAVSLALGFGILELAGIGRTEALAQLAGRGRRIFALFAPLTGAWLLGVTALSPAGGRLLPWATGALFLALILAVTARFRRAAYVTVGTGLLALLLADLAAEGALLAQPHHLAYAAPTHPTSAWLPALWFLLHQVLAGGGTAGFLTAAVGVFAREPDRARALGAAGVTAGLLFLVPQPVVGYYYCEQLMYHYTSAWAMLMGGGVRHLWYYTTWLAVALFMAALVGVAVTRLFPWREGGMARGRVVAGLVLVMAGLAAAVVYGGSIMVPRFTREMGGAAVAGLAIAAALAAFTVRGLLLGTGILSLTVLVLMGLGWARADSLLAYKNQLAVRPPTVVVANWAQAVAEGQKLARYAGCFTCHGAAGSAYRPNPGAPPGVTVPAWSSPAFAATFGGPAGRQKLFTVLWDGQYAYRMRYYPQGNNWSVQFDTIDNYYNVPAWNGILTRRQMGYLITYIQSRIPAKG